MAWHWRNTMRSPRFFTLDARAAFPFLFLLIHFRIWTLVVAICITAVFYWAERHGFSYEVAVRRVRSFVVGKQRFATSLTSRRRMLDFRE